MASGYDKKKQIELQNIIFDTNEKKLMVSPEFLQEMTRHYISKRIKIINNNMKNIVATKSLQSLFTYFDIIFKALDELIVLQDFHSFKPPTPLTVKNTLINKKGRYIIAVLNRIWKEANIRAKFDPRSNEQRNVKDFEHVLDEFLLYKDLYTPDSMDVLNKFYSSVYGHKIDEEPVVTEEASDELLPEDEFINSKDSLDDELPIDE